MIMIPNALANVNKLNLTVKCYLFFLIYKHYIYYIDQEVIVINRCTNKDIEVICASDTLVQYWLINRYYIKIFTKTH